MGLQRYAIVIVFAALIVGFGIDMPSTFLSIGNLSNILGSQAVLFILVMAVLLPTVVGDFVDLSLGSSLGLSAMTLAVLNVQHGTTGRSSPAWRGSARRSWSAWSTSSSWCTSTTTRSS